MLGNFGETKNLEIIEAKGLTQWNSDLIVLGAQAVKSMEFYKLMQILVTKWMNRI
jgi:hypothetical protein